MEVDTLGNASLHSRYYDYVNRPNNDLMDSLSLYEYTSIWQRVPLSQCTAANPKLQLLFANNYHPKFRCVLRRRIQNADGLTCSWYGAPEVPAVPCMWSPARMPSRIAEPELWAKLMLCLFKPWRHPSDLIDRSERQTWADAYDAWDRAGMSSIAVKYWRNIKAINEGVHQAKQKRDDDSDNDENDDGDNSNDDNEILTIKSRIRTTHTMPGSDTSTISFADFGMAVPTTAAAAAAVDADEYDDRNIVFDGNGSDDDDNDNKYNSSGSGINGSLDNQLHIDSLFNQFGSDKEGQFVQSAIDTMKNTGAYLPNLRTLRDRRNLTWPALRVPDGIDLFAFERQLVNIDIPDISQKDMEAVIGQMRQREQKRMQRPAPSIVTPNGNNNVMMMPPNKSPAAPVLVDASVMLSPKQIADEFTLNNEQRVAFYRVSYQLLHSLGYECEEMNDHKAAAAMATIAPKLPEQLLMVVLGPGGTGKTVVIRAIQELFKRYNQSHILRLGAYMGQPASAIGGRTLCSMLNLKSDEEDGVKHRRPGPEKQEEWKNVEWLVIDEISLVGLKMLCSLSHALHQLKNISSSSSKTTHQPFGGLNVIFFGDFKQFPPIMDTPLWNIEQSTVTQIAEGQNIWSQLTDVVELNEQKRQTDKEYSDFLNAMRDDKCSQSHVNYCNKRLYTNLSLEERDTFRDAPVIVSRNSLRSVFNLNYCKMIESITQNPLVIAVAHDCPKDKLSPEFKQFLLNIPDRNQRLVPYVPLVIGMAVMLKQNVATELGLYNGAEGMIVNIKYHEDDERRVAAYVKSHAQGGIKLKHLPEYVLVHFPNCKVSFDELGLNFPVGVVPIYPHTGQVKITAKKGNNFKLLGGAKSKTWQRRQLPLVPAHCMSDYSSQGRTMDKAIIDCQQVPKEMGPVGAANVYVALSRLRTYDGLALLRPITLLDLKRKWPSGLKWQLEALHIKAAKTRILVDQLLNYHHVEPFEMLTNHTEFCLCSACAAAVSVRPLSVIDKPLTPQQKAKQTRLRKKLINAEIAKHANRKTNDGGKQQVVKELRGKTIIMAAAATANVNNKCDEYKEECDEQETKLPLITSAIAVTANSTYVGNILPNTIIVVVVCCMAEQMCGFVLFW